ncbi:hypothetical protein HY968_03370 [Candidatus Kaiserbacteria bacterium]|nr:hypothetical protein [Candidatus Kaiserbacteria bacterium]
MKFLLTVAGLFLLVAAGFYVIDLVQGPHPTPASVATATSTFTDPGVFRFDYPTTFTLSGKVYGETQDWKQGSTTSGALLATIMIPGDFEPQTNFSDAKFTVGTSTNPGAITTCLTEGNGAAASSTSVAINGASFSRISFDGAGAGNFYETTSYRTVHNGECYAIEYTIHSTNIGNYSPDQGIKEFDKAKVQNALEAMVQSLTFLK